MDGLKGHKTKQVAAGTTESSMLSRTYEEIAMSPVPILRPDCQVSLAGSFVHCQMYMQNLEKRKSVQFPQPWQSNVFVTY
jgi:hypothetical protein